MASEQPVVTFDGVEDLEAIRDNVKLVLTWIGEGVCGDYDDTDPEDEPMMRFEVWAKAPEDPEDRKHWFQQNPKDAYPFMDEAQGDDSWFPLEDGSYCTNISASLPREILQALADYLLEEVFAPASQNHPVKKLGERLSWIDASWRERRGRVVPENPDPQD